jgi:hypothetical protein
MNLTTKLQGTLEAIEVPWGITQLPMSKLQISQNRCTNMLAHLGSLLFATKNNENSRPDLMDVLCLESNSNNCESLFVRQLGEFESWLLLRWYKNWLVLLELIMALWLCKQIFLLLLLLEIFKNEAMGLRCCSLVQHFSSMLKGPIPSITDTHTHTEKPNSNKQKTKKQTNKQTNQKPKKLHDNPSLTIFGSTGFEFRTWCLLVRHCTIWATLLPPLAIFQVFQN